MMTMIEWQTVSEIVHRYRLLECDRCAIAVMQWLRENGTHDGVRIDYVAIPIAIGILASMGVGSFRP
jgi:Papain fold toxin 2